MKSTSASQALSVWWRTKLDLKGGKSLDQNHGAAAQRTYPEWTLFISPARLNCRRMRGERCASEQLVAQREEVTATAAGEETEVPDTHEAPRQHVQQETAQELIDRQSQEAFFVFVSGIPPSECYFSILEANETAIGNCNTMGISAEIAQHLLGPAERRFQIDDPAQGEQLTDETLKQHGL